MEKLSRYQKAALVWLEKNSGKTLANCQQRETVELENGQVIRLGNQLSRLRAIYRAMMEGKKYQDRRNLTVEEITWWEKHGMQWKYKRQSNPDYRKAALVWLEKNPGKTLSDCAFQTVVKLKNGEEIRLGNYLNQICGTYRATKNGQDSTYHQNFTEEEIAWWKTHGLSFELRYKDHLFYQNAALVWLEKNPGKTLADCTRTEKVILADGKIVNLGVYLVRLRVIYRSMMVNGKKSKYSHLTEEEIAWWSNRGMVWQNVFTSARYQEAALLWLEKNPDKILMDCHCQEKVTLKNGDSVLLGSYLLRLRTIYDAMQCGEQCSEYWLLTEKDIDWWSKHGMIWVRREDLQYSIQKAALIWLKNNPGKTLCDCDSTVLVSISSRKVIKLGEYIAQMKANPQNLADEDMYWWSCYGLSLSKKRTFSKKKETLKQQHISKKSVRDGMEKNFQNNAVEDWFYEIYQEVLKKYEKQTVYDESTLVRIADEISSEYLLNLEEKKCLYQYLKDYFVQMKEIHIQEVGLEKTEEKKLEKIQKYDLDEYDIEESFLRSVQDLSMKGYIIDWNYYSIQEKRRFQRQNGFNAQDMRYMKSVRENIDQVIEKVKRM